MSKQEKRAKAIANLKMELYRVLKGTFEFSRLFLFYIIVLLTSAIIFGFSQFYPNLEKTLSASRSTPWGIVTSIFTHSSISHIALNMGSLFLFIFLFAFCNSTFTLHVKKRIEIYFLVSTFVFALIANIFWIALTSNPSVGASGLVYAVQGTLDGFSLSNALQLLDFKKFKPQRISTMYIVFMNIVITLVIIGQVFINTDSFLGVGQGVNIIAHGISFLLGMFVSFPWYYVIGKISILN